MPLRLDLNTKFGRAAKSCLEGGALPPLFLHWQLPDHDEKTMKKAARKAIAQGESCGTLRQLSNVSPIYPEAVIGS